MQSKRQINMNVGIIYMKCMLSAALSSGSYVDLFHLSQLTHRTRTSVEYTYITKYIAMGMVFSPILGGMRWMRVCISHMHTKLL